MSQNFSAYKGAPQSSLESTGQNFEDLSGSLIHPGPNTPIQQQNYQPIWSGASAWKNQGHNNNYSIQYQTPTTDSSSYYPNYQQSFVPFDRNIKDYEIDNGGANLDISQSLQSSAQTVEDIGSRAVHERLQPHLPDLLNHPTLSGSLSDGPRKTRGLNGMADSPKSKQDTSALNDRAAELRAKLLAKRGSTPVAPLNVMNKSATSSNTTNKSNETKSKNADEAKSSTKKINNSESASAIAEHLLVVDKPQRLTRMAPSNNSATNLQASIPEKINASTDIDGLLAEGRAAAAAEPIKVVSKHGNGSNARNNSFGNLNEESKNPPSDKNYNGRIEGRRRNLNKSTSSSDMSELGEIRSESGRALGAFNTAPEPVEIKAPKDSNRATGPNFSLPYTNNKPVKQSMRPHDNEPGDSTLRNSSDSKSAHANQNSADISPSHLRDQPQKFKYDDHRDRPGLPLSATDMRKEPEQDSQRDSDLKERSGETRRSLGHQLYGHGVYRDRIVEYRRDNDNRKPYIHRHDVEESARLAAEYKKELEARRQQESRAATERSENPRFNDRKEIEPVRLKTPEPKYLVKKQVHLSTRPEQNIEHNIDKETASTPSKDLSNSIEKENKEDVRDWLEMTGYFDANYRNKALNRFRKIKVLDIQRAELEREAQLEIERRSHFARSQSTVMREGVEASVSGAAQSPQNTRSSVVDMPPPPTPTKQAVDDVGIKIKDSANREGLSRETDMHGDQKHAGEPFKTSTQTLKRVHLDDDPEYIRNQPIEKISRIDSNGRMSDKKSLDSPTTTKGESRTTENRATRSSARQPNEPRAKSRSLKSRSRSSSPVRGRAFVYDQYIPRQRSRDPAFRRNRYSPARQSKLEFSTSNDKPSKIDNRWCQNCEQPGHWTQNCFQPLRRDINALDRPSNDISNSSVHFNNKTVIKKEIDQNTDNIADHHVSETRPFIGHYQQYQPSYYRARGKFGRGGVSSVNAHGAYKPFRSNDGAQDGQQSGGSASLNLEAGDSRYFMIKSWNSENVEIAQRDCTWATQEKNLAVLTEAFNTCRNVILVFSINNSRAFQGYARMTSLPGTAPTPTWAKELIWEATPPFHIQWITIAETRFNRVGHLKNSLNEMQAVLVGRDGQEIEGECGRALCELIDDEGRGGGSGRWGIRPEWTIEMEI